ncbi:MAG: ABC transporter substrate-binding protein, partial [Xanthobacteraceae bacterium]
KSPYMVRTSSTTPQLNYTFGQWAVKNGSKKIYTMVSDYGPGIDAETWFQNGFKDAGGEIVGSVRFPVANPDFSAFVQRAKDANPDAIYIWVPGGTQPAAVGKALAERGIDPSKTKILGQDALADESALKSMGNLALGIITVANYDYNHDSPLNHAFVTAYNNDFHRNPDFFSIGGYDGMHLIYAALQKTGGKTDGDSLIAAAKGMSWESPRGPVLIDPETRDVVQTVYIRQVQRVGNDLRNVEIDKVANVKDPAKARMKQ